MRKHYRPGKITPLKGSPIGRIVINQSEEHTDEHMPISIPDLETGEELTVCYCGWSFPEHSEDELLYIKENNKCRKLARTVP